MCGRYSLTADPNVVKETFNLDEVPAEMQARYNIAPTQQVPIISNHAPKQITFSQWGLIPSWSKDPKIGSKMINARSETVAEKPSFRSAFKQRRCILPVDGFYEWAKSGKTKTPMYVHMKGHTLFGLAGLWEVWNSPDGEQVHSCTILTTEANDFLRPYHHRMAVILEPGQYDVWLSDQVLDASDTAEFFQPYPQEKMALYEVSTLVNKVVNDSPALIEPYTAPRQSSLF